jgi:hypothetical protein
MNDLVKCSGQTSDIDTEIKWAKYKSKIITIWEKSKHVPSFPSNSITSPSTWW